MDNWVFIEEESSYNKFEIWYPFKTKIIKSKELEIMKIFHQNVYANAVLQSSPFCFPLCCEPLVAQRGITLPLCPSLLSVYNCFFFLSAEGVFLLFVFQQSTAGRATTYSPIHLKIRLFVCSVPIVLGSLLSRRTRRRPS